MELRNLGRSGLRVSLIGLGCNNFGERTGLEDARAIVHKALDLGITLLDTADRYGGPGGSEKCLGEILGPKRQDIVLASKFGWDIYKRGVVAGGARRYVMKAVEDSLQRLKTDWIDLYQMHTPDPATPMEETLRALDDLIRDGKVRYIGLSNFRAWQVVQAEWIARELGTHRCVSVQDEYSIVHRGHDKELIPAIRAYGLGLLPYRPLASGLLTGKYRRDQQWPEGTRFAKMKHHVARYASDRNFDVAERLQEFAKARGRTPIELALSWLASRPFVSSILSGASSPEQIEANVAATGWQLSEEDLAEIDRLTA